MFVLTVIISLFVFIALSGADLLVENTSPDEFSDMGGVERK